MHLISKFLDPKQLFSKNCRISKLYCIILVYVYLQYTVYTSQSNLFLKEVFHFLTGNKNFTDFLNGFFSPTHIVLLSVCYRRTDRQAFSKKCQKSENFYKNHKKVINFFYWRSNSKIFLQNLNFLKLSLSLIVQW